MITFFVIAVSLTALLALHLAWKAHLLITKLGWRISSKDKRLLTIVSALINQLDKDARTRACSQFAYCYQTDDLGEATMLARMFIKSEHTVKSDAEDDQLFQDLLKKTFYDMNNPEAFKNKIISHDEDRDTHWFQDSLTYSIEKIAEQ